jgi:hypothetical protein
VSCDEARGESLCMDVGKLLESLVVLGTAQEMVIGIAMVMAKRWMVKRV